MRNRVFGLVAVIGSLGISQTVVAQGAPEAPAQQQGGSSSDLKPNPPVNVYTPRSGVQATPMRVQVIDAVSFADVETKATYRLYGVDACSLLQSATLGKQQWPCGSVALAWMVSATLNKWITCNDVRPGDAKSAGLVRCATAEHADLALDMLKEGMAVVPPDPLDRQVKAYLSAEQDAKHAYRGMWSSSFQMPWLFRADLEKIVRDGLKDNGTDLPPQPNSEVPEPQKP